MERNGTERYSKTKNGKEDADIMRDIKNAMADISEMNLIHLDRT